MRSIELVPFRGFGDIRFGMTQEAVRRILGPATSEAVTADLGDLDLNYEHLGISLSFSRESGFRLENIAVENPNAVLCGIRPISKLKEQLLKHASVLGELEKEDEFPEINAEDYWSESLGVSFWVVNGRVESITLFPEYDGDAPVWPDEFD